MFGHRHRGSKPDAPGLAPTRPFLFRAIVITDRVGASVGEAKIVVFIQADAEGFEQRFVAFIRAGDPMAEAGERRNLDPKISRPKHTLHVSDPRRVRRIRPDELRLSRRRTFADVRTTAKQNATDRNQNQTRVASPKA